MWREWKLPEVRVPSIQANANVVVLEKSEDSTFDYWVRISTLDKGNPLRVPVKLASYHRQTIAGRTLNTSTTLYKRKGSWWLTLSLCRTFLLKPHQKLPRSESTWASCISSRPRRTKNMAVSVARWPDNTSGTARRGGANPN